MELRLAKESELHQVYTLYQSVIGSPFCTWNEEYPGMPEIYADYQAESLYVAIQNNQIIGAVSVVPENELDSLPFWKSYSAIEIARVVVSPAFQGSGIAKKMITTLLTQKLQKGISAVHLLVADANLPAQKVYYHCGFTYCGECDMFGHHFLALEAEIYA